MILVSFSFAEDALSNDVKKYYIFSPQGTANPPFRFFVTPGIIDQSRAALRIYLDCMRYGME